MDQMVRSLIAADKAGNLTAANPVIDRIGRAIGQ